MENCLVQGASAGMQIDINWEERSPLQETVLGYRGDVEMPPPCPAGEIIIDWEEHIPLQFASVRTPEPRRRVRFNSKVRVILAPSREDFKSLRCNLWWKRQDYLLFQQSSYKEVRLYSVFHGLRFKDARRALYQNMDEKDEFGLLSCVAPPKQDPDGDDDDNTACTTETVTYVEDAYGCYSMVIEDAEDEDEGHPIYLYVPHAQLADLRDEEHSRHDYYNKYHSLLSRAFWVSAGAFLTAASMASFLTPLIGYYVIAFLQITYLGEFI